jgi:hypothetical protein
MDDFSSFLSAWNGYTLLIRYASSKLSSTDEPVSPPTQSVLTAVEPGALDHFYQQSKRKKKSQSMQSPELIVEEFIELCLHLNL